MPATILCTKCQARYELPESALGKTVQCKKCGERFVASAAAKSVKSGVTPSSQPALRRAPAPANPRYSPGPPAEELALLGLGGPIRRAADPLSEDLTPPPKDILGNFAADPGFNATAATPISARTAPVVTIEGLENPYAKEIKIANKKRRDLQGEPGYRYGSLKTIELVERIITFALVAFFLLFGVSIALMLFSGEEPSSLPVMLLIVSFVGMIPLSIAWIVMLVIFVYRANCNLRAMGTKGLKFSPGLAVGSFFIPIVSIAWPCMAMGEIYKASHNPLGTRWTKAPFPGIVLAWWVMNLIGLGLISLFVQLSILKTIRQKQDKFVG